MASPRSAIRATTDFVGDAAVIWDSVCSMYDAYLAADRVWADSYIDDDCTMWDSANAPMIRGLDALGRLRDSRAPGAGPESVASVAALEPVIDVWNDTALVRHVLVVEFMPDAQNGVVPPTERIRNTGVWRRTDSRWLIVHNHEDTLPDGVDPIVDPPLHLPV